VKRHISEGKIMLPQKFILGKDSEIAYVEGPEVSVFWGKRRCIELSFKQIFYFSVFYLIVELDLHFVC
jgi:hypothetical protein